MEKLFDIIIIGAGVSGSACARELSRYKANILVLEKEEDVCCGTTKANSAIVHAGYDAETGSLMAKLNVQGSKMMEELSKELDFHYDRCGSLVLCMAQDDMPNLQKLYEKGVPRDLWDDAVAVLPDAGEQIDAFLRNKLRGQTPDEKAKKRLTDALLRRGFSWSEVKAGMRRLGAEIGENDTWN